MTRLVAARYEAAGDHLAEFFESEVDALKRLPRLGAFDPLGEVQP